MNIKEEDFKKEYYKKFNGVIYTPQYNYDDYKNGMYIGLTIDKTADEIYNEILENNDRINKKEPSAQEKLNAQLLKSNLEFQKALAEQKKVNANLLLQIQSLQKKEGNE